MLFFSQAGPSSSMSSSMGHSLCNSMRNDGSLTSSLTGSITNRRMLNRRSVSHEGERVALVSIELGCACWPCARIPCSVLPNVDLLLWQCRVGAMSHDACVLLNVVIFFSNMCCSVWYGILLGRPFMCMDCTA